MPLVVDAIREKNFAYSQVVSQLGAVAFSDRSHIVLPEVKRWQLTQGDAARYSHASMLTGSLLTRKMFAPLFPRLKEGILPDVFIQKAVVAWDNAPSNRIMVSLLLPGPMEMDQWLKDAEPV